MDDTFSTTFWMDFSIAEVDGEVGVRETFKRAFEEWKDDVRYLADLVITLNHKIHWHWEKDPESPLIEVYEDLWEKSDLWALENLSEKDLSYYLEVTD